MLLLQSIRGLVQWNPLFLLGQALQSPFGGRTSFSSAGGASVYGPSARRDQIAIKAQPMNVNVGVEVALNDPLCGLVVRLQAGDKAALEEIIRQTQKLGYRLAFSLLQDRQLAEDALQEVYLKVYQNLNQLREPKAFKGWFCRILSNHCGKMRRKQTTDFLEDLTPSQQPQQTCQDSEVDTRLEVRQAFAQLSESDKEVLALREVLDLSYEEISTTLKVPTTTIKTRLFKARQRLLKFLGGRS